MDYTDACAQRSKFADDYIAGVFYAIANHPSHFLAKSFSGQHRGYALPKGQRLHGKIMYVVSLVVRMLGQGSLVLSVLVPMSCVVNAKTTTTLFCLSSFGSCYLR